MKHLFLIALAITCAQTAHAQLGFTLVSQETRQLKLTINPGNFSCTEGISGGFGSTNLHLISGVIPYDLSKNITNGLIENLFYPSSGSGTECLAPMSEINQKIRESGGKIQASVTHEVYDVRMTENGDTSGSIICVLTLLDELTVNVAGHQLKGNAEFRIGEIPMSECQRQ